MDGERSLDKPIDVQGTAFKGPSTAGVPGIARSESSISSTEVPSERKGKKLFGMFRNRKSDLEETEPSRDLGGVIPS